MEYIGKYGEYRVLARLLEDNIEAYQAIKTNQQDYDITAVLSEKNVVRIQVKSTTLQSDNTNNHVGALNGVFDFLVVVVVDVKDQADQEDVARFFVMTREEAHAAKENKKLLAISYSRARRYYVKSIIEQHENRFDKIREAK